MTRALVTAELRRLAATRLWWVGLLVAVGFGGGLTGALALTGPEHFTPPMPGLHTATGVRLVLGMLGFTAFVPAALGTLAMTTEYRYRTVDVTFLFVPARGRVVVAKLVAYTVAGLAYGATLAVTAGLGLYGGAAARGVPLGLSAPVVAGLLARIGVAMAVYTVLGVAVGALLRNQILALAVVVGYLYAGETLLMIIPGVNTLYPVLPGGALSALTGFHYVADAVAQQVPTGGIRLLPPTTGALLLLGYAAVAATVAVLAPLRRDVR